MPEVKTRRLKTWTALGLAALGTAGMAPADGVTGTAVQAPANMILAEADGEGGGGGEERRRWRFERHLRAGQHRRQCLQI